MPGLNKMNKRKVIFWGLIIGASSYISYKHLWVIGINPQVNKCGILVRKQSPTTMDIHKHSADIRIQDKFTMKFDDGSWSDIDVDARTWNSFEVGDKLCFDRPVKTDIAHEIWGFYSIIFLFIMACFLLWGIVEAFKWFYQSFIDADSFKNSDG